MDFRTDVPRFLKDAYRVLRPGGWIRIVVPDGGRWLRAYANGSASEWQSLGMDRLPDDMPTHMAMINHVFHQSGEHLFAYDWETMAYVLGQAGFGRIEQRTFGQTACDGLAVDQPHHAPYSLYVEAEKPAE
jgi:predicted SAM-dependent methyltransferase